MISACLVLRAHQPYRLRPYNYFDVGRRHDYFDAEEDRLRLARSDRLCYAPATDMLERLLERHPPFAFSLSLSGPLLERLRAQAPGRLAGFRGLVEGGRVEPLCATSHQCLPGAVSNSELEAQIRLHRRSVESALGRAPEVCEGEEPRDVERIAAVAEANAFSGMVVRASLPAAGAQRQSLYRTSTPRGLPLILADVLPPQDALRGRPRRGPADEARIGEALDGWISTAPGDILCVSMDLATFGLRHPRESGVFDSFEAWAARAVSRPDLRFLTLSEAFTDGHPSRSLPREMVSARPANEMQQDALARLASLEERVEAAGSAPLLEDFRRLTSSDHFRQMTLRAGDVGREPGRLESAYEAYMAYRHVLSDLEARLPRRRPERALSVGPTPA